MLDHAHGSIRFNTVAGPIELRRGDGTRRCYRSIDQVLELARFCAERDIPAPIAVSLAPVDFDMLTRMLLESGVRPVIGQPETD